MTRTDGGLGDTLDVVTQNLAVTLGAALSQTLAALSIDKVSCQQEIVMRCAPCDDPHLSACDNDEVIGNEECGERCEVSIPCQC